MIKFKKVKVKVIVSAIAIGMTLAVPTGMVAYADQGQDESIQAYVNGDMPSQSINNSITEGGTTLDTTNYPRNEYNHYQSNSGTYYYVKKGNESTLGGAIKDYNSANAQSVGNDLKDITGGLKIDADTTTATNALSGFVPIISTILGLMVILISIGMTIFSVFDLCYIAFPVFRNKCEEAKQSGSGMMVSNKKGADGETKLRLVSDDAQYAVTAADTVQSGKNPFVIYFGKRLLSYIILAILLFILLTGNVTVFTDIALKVVSGILDLIQGI
jgi:hypothetical protein